MLNFHQLSDPGSSVVTPASRGDRRRSRVVSAKRFDTETLVVVGNGMVGFKFCEHLVALGGEGAFQIIVFGEEPNPAYDRVHLTQYLSGRQPDSLLMAPKEWYAEHGITLHCGRSIVRIDRERKSLLTEDGSEIGYDVLVMATGSRAFVPPLEGADLSNVFVYRTLRDLQSIQMAARQARQAAVMGGGLLGLEAAMALQELGLETHLVEHGSGLMARQLGPEGSAVLKTHIDSLGLQVRLNAETERIETQGERRVLRFSDGRTLEVDLVVLATGIRPRDELAYDAGLALGPRGGVAVNDHLQTSDPAIFAIGECACHDKVIYGLAAPGFKMASALARHLMGLRARFEGDDLSARLKLKGVEVMTMGDFQANGSTIQRKEDGVFRELVLQGNRLVGATGVGRWPELNRVQEAIDARRRIWPWQIRRFHAEGRLWPEFESAHVSHWPSSALVCHCVRVTRGTLTRAMGQPACGSVDALARVTGASTVCGTCKPLLADLVGETLELQPEKRWRKLLAVSVASLVGVLLIVALRPWPFAESVQGGWKLDALWRSDVLKQWTGYTLLGVILLSLALSLRKRWRWFAKLEFGWWRLLHAVLGTISLVALVTHTGLRLGHHLNLVLMINFLLLVVMGGLAGLLTAMETKWPGPWPRRWRACWTTAHMLLFWPMPVLILFHVLKFYYY